MATASTKAVRVLGLCDRVNICEPLINFVSSDKPKGTGLGPKGKWSGIGVSRSPIVDVAPPEDRWDLSHTGIHTERGKPHVLLLGGS